MADTTEATPAIEPTEMSSAPETMTMVMPTPSSPTTLRFMPIFIRLRGAKKNGVCEAISATSSTRAMISDRFSAPTKRVIAFNGLLLLLGWMEELDMLVIVSSGLRRRAGRARG